MVYCIKQKFEPTKHIIRKSRLNTPLTLHDIIIQITIWTLIDLVAKIIIFTIVMALIIISCLMAFNKPLPNQHKSPIKQKKSRAILYTILTSLIPFPATFIITYIFIYVSESGKSNSIQKFLDRVHNNPSLIAILMVLMPIFIYPFLVYASMSKEAQDINEKEVQIKESTSPPKKTKKKTKKKAGKKAESNENGAILSAFLKHSKALISSSTILAIIVYMSVLNLNLDSASGNLGTALQITSIQFSENKFKWIAQLSMYILLAYLTLLPALLVPKLKKYVRLHESFSFLKGFNPQNPAHLCMALILLSTILTTIVNICITALFLSTLKDNIEFFLISTPMLSYAFCAISIILTINRKFQITSSQTKRLKITLSESFLWLSVSVLLLFIAYIFITYIPYDLGRVIANPGKSLGSSESTYDCVFPTDPKSRDSIAFGVITASKPESIHIFTPTYDHESSSYGKRTDKGGIELNNLTETQIKISGGYRIEKFDNDKHEYDLTSGKCIYKNSLPFYMHTYPWYKTV